MNGNQKHSGKPTYRSAVKTSPNRNRYSSSRSQYHQSKLSERFKLSPQHSAFGPQIINAEPDSLFVDGDFKDHRNSYSFSHELSTIIKCRQHDFNNTNNKGNKSLLCNKPQKSEKPSINHLSQAESGIEKALEQHRQMKLRLEDLRREKLRQQEQNFKSEVPAANYQKLKVQSQHRSLPAADPHVPFWKCREAAHKQRLAKQQEEVTADRLKECTFQPALIAKERSNRILKKKEDLIALEKEKEVANSVTKFQEVGKVVSFAPKPKNAANFDYKTMKNLIHREIKRLS